MERIRLGKTEIDVTFKDIKNVHLSVNPPDGHVRISAPSRMNLETIRVFAIAKLGWIRKQQSIIRNQERETERLYIDRESHYLWGERKLLKVVGGACASGVEIKGRWMVLSLRASSSGREPDPDQERKRRGRIMNEWYRAQVKSELAELTGKWTPVVGAEPAAIHVRRMKTKWGSFSRRTGAITLNTDLAKKPRECLEYVFVHELVHLLEPTHNARFQLLMDRFIPHWRHIRTVLNSLPLRHEDWGY